MKTFLNFLFPLFSGIGAFFIFTSTNQIVFIVPTGLIILYALITAKAVSGTSDRHFKEHHVDSIYFLGFLYTLVSLITLFYKFYSVQSDNLTDTIVTLTFYYLGISITTSVTGVLLRNIVRGYYLKNQNDESADLEKSYALLKKIADEFAYNYRETFKTIQDYLEERTRTTATVHQKEKEYIQALESFNTSTEQFSRNLTGAQDKLTTKINSLTNTISQNEEPIEEFTNALHRISHEAHEIAQQGKSLQIQELAQDLDHLRSKTGDLDGVIDSLIKILEKKVEKVI